MNDPEIDRLMRLARPTPSAGLSPGGRELLEEIVSLAPERPESAPVTMESIEVGPPRYRPGPRRGRRILVAVGVVLIVLAAILTPALLSARGGPSSPAGTPTPTATATQTNPFLLMRTPGWKVDEVQVQEGGLNGQVVFAGPGPAQLVVSWGQRDDQEEIYQSQINAFGKPLNTTVLGEPASLFEIPGKQPYQHLLVPKPGGRPIGLGGGGTDLKTFQQQVRGLVAVTPGQWYAAVRDQVVAADDVTAAVTRVLTGVPRPEGFEASKYTGDLPNDYFMFGENLTGGVVCGWLNTYRRAWTAGDEPGMAAVEKVLRGAKEWKFVRQADQPPAWVDGLPPDLAKMATRTDLTDALGSFVCP